MTTAKKTKPEIPTSDQASPAPVQAVQPPALTLDRLVPVEGRLVDEVRFVTAVSVGGAGGKVESFITKLKGPLYTETLMVATESFLWIRHTKKPTEKPTTTLVPMSNVAWMLLGD